MENNQAPGQGPKEEKTTVENNAQPQNSSAGSAAPSTAPAKATSSGSGLSTGAAVGMAGAAGVVGLAAGTVFSEDIKGVVDGITDRLNPEESAIGAEPEEITETPVEGAVHTSTTTESGGVGETETPVSIVSPPEVLEFSVTDDNGNVYAVSLTDYDHDGEVDSSALDVWTSDGVNVHYEQQGNILEEIFQQENESFAVEEDYQQFGEDFFCGEINEPLLQDTAGISETEAFVASESYTGEGDVVEAEIQEEIPVGEVDSIESEWTTVEEQYITEPVTQEDLVGNETEDVLPETSDIEMEASENYEAIDWASIEDQPLSEDYSSSLAEYDFESYDTPDAYVEESFDFSSGSDDIVTDFI